MPRKIVPEGCTLYPYQREGIKFLLKRKRSILGDVMGLGKTPQAIVTSTGYKSKPIVVIGPAIGRYNWLHEFNTWSAVKHNINVITSKKTPLTGNETVFIISYNLAATEPWRSRLKKFLAATSNSLLICDEAHRLKSWGSGWTKVILMELQLYATRCLLLTGTPMVNKITDLHPLFSVCEPRMWGRFEQFAEQYSNKFTTPYGCGVDYRGTKNLPELRRKAKKFMVRRFKKEVLPDLPSKIFTNVYLDIPKSLANKSLQHVEALTKLIEEGKQLKLGEDRDKLSHARRVIGEAKLPSVFDWVDTFFSDNPNTQLVLFAHHVDIADSLNEFVANKGIQSARIMGKTTASQRQKHIDQFQNKKLQVLVCNILAAGTALNLQVAHCCAFAEIDWSPVNLDQAINRFHRIGQKKKVQIFFLLAQNSFETKIIGSLRSKIKEIEKVVN